MADPASPENHKRTEGLSLGGRRVLYSLLAILAVAIALVVLIRLLML